MSGNQEGRPWLGGLLSHPIFAALLLASGALVLREVTLEGNRPPANEPRIEQREALQDTDARLWQDPLGAVARERAALPAEKRSPPGLAGRHTEEAVVDMVAGLANAGHQVVILPVMLPGGPYAESVEYRRRSRYAVLSALNAEQFSPFDTEHLGWYMPRTSGAWATATQLAAGRRRSLPEVIPFETFEPAPDNLEIRPEKTRVLVLWLNGDAFYDEPLARLNELIQPYLHKLNRKPGDAPGADRPRLLVRVLGPLGSDGLRAMVDEVSATPSAAMAGWQGLSRLSAEGGLRIISPGATVADKAFLRPGSSRSGTASGRSGEASAVAEAASTIPALMKRKGIEFLRTIATDQVLTQSLTDELALRGLKAHVTRPSDPTTPLFLDRDSLRLLCWQWGDPRGGMGRALPATVIDERREADRRQPWSAGRLRVAPASGVPMASILPSTGTGPLTLVPPSQVALVTEWDTLYGRSLRRDFMIDDVDATGFCLHRFAYVRGLDGQLPEQGKAQGDVGSKAAAAKDDNRRKDGSFIERPEGQSQFDYLRRLAARLRERDAQLRALHGPEGGIRAIGVLGNDVYDKLLVLQALQADFPTAIFFTTDLDSRLLHPREQAWARNLIVASSYGLSLSDNLQGGTPPLRDSYQTAIYFSMRLIFKDLSDQQKHAAFVARPEDFRDREAPLPPLSVEQWQALLDRWLAKPRVFEVGRTGVFDFEPVRPALVRRPGSAAAADVAASTEAPAWATPLDAAWACRMQVRHCSTIHPPHSPRYPRPGLVALTLGFSAVLLLCWAPVLALKRNWRRGLRRFVARGTTPWRRGRRRAGLVAGVVLVQLAIPAAAASQWDRFANWLTRDGKPISLGEGISLWPSEALHVFSLLLCLYLLMRGWHGLGVNLDRINRALRMGSTRRRLEAEQRRDEATLPPWQRLINTVTLRQHYSARVQASQDRPPRPPGPSHDMNATAEVTWKFFISQNRAGSRLLRSAIGAAVATLACWGLLRAFAEAPGVPQRGTISALWHHWVALGVVGMLTLLVFYVADATLLCVRYLRELRLQKLGWPASTYAAFRKRYGHLPDALLDHWIDLQFIAMRTDSVGQLIYYPFIVLSLLLLSRSSFFDDWHLPLAVQLMAGLCVAIVLGCVVALRQAAEASRSAALKAVSEAQMRAQVPGYQPGTGAASSEQLDLLHERITDLKAGAFAPFSQQPLLKAVLLPFATVGGTSLLDLMAMARI
ncbi:MAG: hypothetical protein RL722_1049 [Pseudomonadota bacterium]